MYARILLFLAVLLPLGCALSTEPGKEGGPALQIDPGAEVLFLPDRTEYSHGDTATVVLRNGSGETLGYNFCLAARELRTGATWTRFEPLRACAAVLYTVAPGAEAVLREPITGEWQPGEYRMTTRVEWMEAGSRTRIFSSPFQVRR